MSTTPLSNTEALLKYLGGGLALGGAAAGTTSLINHLKTLNAKAEAKNDTSSDDDILYVNLRHPTRKQAADDLIHGIGMAGGALTALGGYAGVKKLYQDFKRKQLQKELDAAQNTYLDSMVPAEKSAMSLSKMLDVAIRSPIALSLLTGVGSGVLTNSILNKNFPAPKAPSGLKPKRLVLRDSPDEDETKQAAILDDAAEGLLRTVLEFPDSERSELPDLVKAAAAGDIDGLLAAADKGVDALAAFAKSAKVNPSPEARELAIGWLVREPELAPVIKLAAALEFANACPLMVTLAAGADEETASDLIKLAAAFCQESRTALNVTIPRTLSKSAEVSKQAYDLTDALRMGLEAGKPEENLGSGASEDSTDSVGQRPMVEAQGAKAKAMLSKNQDVIDDILEPNSPTPEGQARPRTKSSPSAVAPAF
jgi:hypothetical protein